MRGFGISGETRDECVKFFSEIYELNDPDRLRAFAHIRGLELVYGCIDASTKIDYSIFFFKLVTTRKSTLEPALFDLLDELGRHFAKEEFKKQRCQDLKEKIRKELVEAEEQERTNQDFEQLVERTIASDTRVSEEAIGMAEQWIDAAGDDLDELALRITLAVFNGTSFDLIERAKDDLLASLQKLVAPPIPDDPPAVVRHVPLMKRIQKAGARETIAEPPNWKKVVELQNETVSFASEAIGYVWQQYRERKWRGALIEWLTRYAVGQAVEVRNRAGVAVGVLAIQDYRFVRDTLLKLWVEASGEDSRMAGEYRMAIGMVLGVLVREKSLASEIQNLIRTWSESKDRSERWAAARAYIYVGIYCRPISEVIGRWRKIAAFEYPAIGVEVLGETFVKLNPLHMSLMDAMRRFFVNVAQQPDQDAREQFAGILEGLRTWIAEGQDDSGMGLFMFSSLGQLSPISEGEVASPPVLLQLIQEDSGQSEYRKQLAEMFKLLMSDGDTIIEARDLLCGWVGWINSLPVGSQSYEQRMQNLLREIIAADTSGRMRGKLTFCLRDCGRNQAVERILSDL
jgi:hypothetical protein